MGKVFLRIMYDKNTLNKPLIGQGFHNNTWSIRTYNFISGPVYEVDNLKGFENKSSLLMYQPSNTFDSSDKYDIPRLSNYCHSKNDEDLDESYFYGGVNFFNYDSTNPDTGLSHDNGKMLHLYNRYPRITYMTTYNTLVVGNEHTVSEAPTKDQLIFYPYLTNNLPDEELINYDIKIANTDSSSHVIDSFNNHGLVGGRKYTIEITNSNKKDYTSNPIYFVNNTDGKYLKLTDDYTFTAENNHHYIITSKKPSTGKEITPAQPVNPEKKQRIIIDFLHDKETSVKILSTDDRIDWHTIVNHPPVNYDFTKNKGLQVYLETDLTPDTTKYITRDDTVYNIYYFKNGKPDDLDINNYSLDYLNTHADTKYTTNPKSNLTGVEETDFNKAGVGMKRYESFKTPCAFVDYGYYLILPVELKECYGVLLGYDGKPVQKIFVNKKNKIEEQYRPKYKHDVIGFYNEAYDTTSGITPPGWYRYHNKYYGLTSNGYIDPNRYDDFICPPMELWITDRLGELPAFILKYVSLNNIKRDLGGYYNPVTDKYDPIIVNKRTGGSTGTGGSASTGGSTGTGGSASTGGSTGTGGSTSTGGSTGTGGSTSTGGSTGTTYPNTPIDLNDQIHLYSINQQNIIDLSTKDLDYQTSLKKFATYDANNFINQVYILPFSLPNNLKELDDHIVTGLYKLNTDTIAINQDHYDLNLGSITIKPKYNNGFDYNVTKCVLHLPFTNLINLDINDILNKTISIKYKVSLLNADTTINILSDDNLIFTGKINIGTDLQLFSINSNNIAGLLNNVLQNEVLVPYITITRNKPINNLVSYETSEHGQLSSYQGYLQTTSATVSCGTQEEQQEIESLLNGGIYIK